MDKSKLIKVETGEGGGADAWDWEKDGKEVSGVYLRKQENIGPNNSNMYHLRLEDGTERAVWGSTGIDMKMGNISVGSTVLIEFEGMLQNEATKRYYKKFNVYYQPAENPDSEPPSLPPLTMQEEAKLKNDEEVKRVNAEIERKMAEKLGPEAPLKIDDPGVTAEDFQA